jgi:hypothetical protein
LRPATSVNDPADFASRVDEMGMAIRVVLGAAAKMPNDPVHKLLTAG